MTDTVPSANDPVPGEDVALRSRLALLDIGPSRNPLDRGRESLGHKGAEAVMALLVVDGCGYHSRIGCDATGSQYECCYPVYRLATA